jgi:hypothetical protein
MKKVEKMKSPKTTHNARFLIWALFVLDQVYVYIDKAETRDEIDRIMELYGATQEMIAGIKNKAW